MRPPREPAGWFGRLVAALLTAALLVAGLFFSIVLVLVAAGLGAVALVYFWWKTRALRQALRAQHESAAAARETGAAGRGTVIEGEARVVDEAPPDGRGRLR